VRVVLVVALHFGAGREPRLADQHRHVPRRRDQGLDRQPLRLDRPLLDEFAAERERRVLAGVDGAAGPHRTDSAPDASPRSSRSAQRISCSSSVSPPSSIANEASRAATPSCDGEPRPRRSAIARSASAVFSGDGS
jgi:hypothetical protein